MKVLYIGGTGEISLACVARSVASGHRVTVFNRGNHSSELRDQVELIEGDIRDDVAYQRLAEHNFDVVCQFLAFDSQIMARDIELFSGHCAQYVFISTASAYEKPPRGIKITEQTPLDNPHWEYSRKKAGCELLLQEHAGRFPSTIVRPSHTYRTRFPGLVVDGNHLAWRILNDKPVLIHDDGESLWTLTHSDDFAVAFDRLLGNGRAVGAQCHITDDTAYSWNDIVLSIGQTLNKRPQLRHLDTTRLLEIIPELVGPMSGDKANSMQFDNSGIRELIGPWECSVSLSDGLDQVKAHFERRLAAGYQPDPKMDELIDRIVNEG